MTAVARTFDILDVHDIACRIREDQRLSFRDISTALAKARFLNEAGKPYHPQSVQRMIDGARPAKKGIPID